MIYFQSRISVTGNITDIKAEQKDISASHELQKIQMFLGGESRAGLNQKTFHN